MAKETYIYGKRDLLIPLERGISEYLVSKEAYLYGKRYLLIWQKRPIYTVGEICPGVKRGLLIQ